MFNEVLTCLLTAEIASRRYGDPSEVGWQSGQQWSHKETSGASGELVSTRSQRSSSEEIRLVEETQAATQGTDCRSHSGL